MFRPNLLEDVPENAKSPNLAITRLIRILHGNRTADCIFFLSKISGPCWRRGRRSRRWTRESPGAWWTPRSSRRTSTIPTTPRPRPAPDLRTTSTKGTLYMVIHLVREDNLLTWNYELRFITSTLYYNATHKSMLTKVLLRPDEYPCS